MAGPAQGPATTPRPDHPTRKAPDMLDDTLGLIITIIAALYLGWFVFFRR